MVDRTVLVGKSAELHFEVDDRSERQVWSSRRRELLDGVGAVLGRNRVGHEFQVIANDRLDAANDDATFSELKPVMAAAVQLAFPGPTFNITRISTDPRERLTMLVRRL